METIEEGALVEVEVMVVGAEIEKVEVGVMVAEVLEVEVELAEAAAIEVEEAQVDLADEEDLSNTPLRIS